MKTLGLIGGTSWHSTVEYYRQINTLVGKKLGADRNPQLWLHSLDVSLMREGNPAKIKEAYLAIGQKLEQLGAHAVVICANTPHMVYEYVQPQLDIPILHIADATAQEAKRLGLKKLGLLGTNPTMKKGFIQARIQQKTNIDVIIPDSLYQNQVHNFIADELTQGDFSPKAKTFFKNQMQLLSNRGADGIILGCTELPMLLKDQDFLLPLLDTTALHCQMAVNFILS